jgi:hypothetical protein
VKRVAAYMHVACIDGAYAVTKLKLCLINFTVSDANGENAVAVYVLALGESKSAVDFQLQILLPFTFGPALRQLGLCLADGAWVLQEQARFFANGPCRGGPYRTFAGLCWWCVEHPVDRPPCARWCGMVWHHTHLDRF